MLMRPQPWSEPQPDYPPDDVEITCRRVAGFERRRAELVEVLLTVLGGMSRRELLFSRVPAALRAQAETEGLLARAIAEARAIEIRNLEREAASDCS
jgi:hypothetical protein